MEHPIKFFLGLEGKEFDNKILPEFDNNIIKLVNINFPLYAKAALYKSQKKSFTIGDDSACSK